MATSDTNRALIYYCIEFLTRPDRLLLPAYTPVKIEERAEPMSRWLPLEHIVYGFAVYPISQATYARPGTALRPEESSASTELHASEEDPALEFVARLDVGDEIYAFEKSGDSNNLWYRGCALVFCSPGIDMTASV